MSPKLIRWIYGVFSAISVVALSWGGMEATASAPTTVGAVESVRGQGWGLSAWGDKYDKLSGDLISQDEIVATGLHSAMTMRFVDNTVMTLGASAEITVDQMVYDPDDGSKDGVTLTLGKGTFYFVSGLVAKEKVTIRTPTSTIGIRGTELVIKVEADGATSVGVAKGHAFMRSNRDGRSVEVEVGNTARSDKEGKVTDSFPGLDLTGEENVDRKIPGVAEWLDEQKEEERKGLLTLASYTSEEDDNKGKTKKTAKKSEMKDEDKNKKRADKSRLGDEDDGDFSRGAEEDGADVAELSRSAGEDGHHDGVEGGAGHEGGQASEGGEGGDRADGADGAGGAEGGDGQADGGDDGHDSDSHDHEGDRSGREASRDGRDRDRHGRES